MKQKDIQEFIYFMTHNKSLTRAQQRKRDELLARTMSTGQISEGGNTPPIDTVPPPYSFKPMSALETAHFLSLFNNPMGLKYLTHDFDVEDDGRPHTLEALYTQAKKILQKKEQPIPSSLWAPINNYLEGKSKWFDTFEQPHSSCIKDPAWVDWSHKNQMHPVNNPEYEKEIMAFRSTMRLVPPSLQEICSKAKIGLSLQFTEEKLDKADFYTNTYILFLALKRIMQMMNRRVSKCPNVSVSYKRKTDSNGRMLRQIIISQKDSFADKTIEDVMMRLKKNPEAGDFGSLRKLLNGYCLWQVESLWDEQPYRWNILKTEEMPETEPINKEAITGFTHILTYYLV